MIVYVRIFIDNDADSIVPRPHFSSDNHNTMSKWSLLSLIVILSKVVHG